MSLQSPHFKTVLQTSLKDKYTTGELQSTTAMTHYHLLYPKPCKTSKHYFISNLLICCYFNMNAQINQTKPELYSQDGTSLSPVPKTCSERGGVRHIPALMCSHSFRTGLVCIGSQVLTYLTCSQSMEMHIVA